MIYRFLHNNKSYHFIVLPLIAALLWGGAFIHPEKHQFSIDTTHLMPLYQPFYQLMQWSNVAANLLAIALLTLAAFLLVQLNRRFLFLEQKSFLLSYIFVLIVGGFTSLHYLSPVYFVNIFGVLAIACIFNSEKEETPYGSIFKTGLIFGVASLFYLPVVFLLPLVWLIYQLIQKNFTWRYFLLPIIGLLIPWLYAFTYYFFVGHTALFFEIVETNFFVGEHRFVGDNYELYYLLVLFALMILSGISLLRTFENKGSTPRYFFQSFIAIGVISAFVVLAVPSASKEMLLLVAGSASCILANYLMVIRRKFWSNALLYFLIILVIFLQLV